MLFGVSGCVFRIKSPKIDAWVTSDCVYQEAKSTFLVCSAIGIIYITMYPTYHARVLLRLTTVETLVVLGLSSRVSSARRTWSYTSSHHSLVSWWSRVYLLQSWYCRSLLVPWAKHHNKHNVTAFSPDQVWLIPLKWSSLEFSPSELKGTDYNRLASSIDLWIWRLSVLLEVRRLRYPHV